MNVYKYRYMYLYTNVPNESVKCFFLIEHNITYRYYVLHDIHVPVSKN